MSHLTKKILSFLFIASGLFLFAHLGFAQDANTVGMEFGAETGLGSEDPRIMAANIVRIFLAFLGVVAISLMIYAGFIWMTSQGNIEKIDKAKKIITGAIIGLVIVLSAFAIASFVISQILDATQGSDGDDYSGGDNIENIGGGGGGTSCDGNPLTSQCEPDVSLCAEGEYCDDHNCTCETEGNVGDPCDSDPETDQCEADDNMCAEHLKCDSETCLCGGAPVIESVTPAGGFCEGDPNISCQRNGDCPDSECDRGTPNGAPGNLVTIRGKYFGTSTGQVYFSDGSGFNAQAVMPSEKNPDCTDNWDDNQVIVVVPEGAENGPIMLMRSDEEEDTTDNSRGDKLPDFVVNDIERPGLCLLDPEEGRLNDPISYYGLNLSQSTAYFGSYETNKEAKNSNFASPLSGSAEVPLIEAGETTSFVVKDDTSSNVLDFAKIKEPDSGPFINYFEPIQGPPGQYITIHGDGFGKSGAGKTVYFGDEVTGVEAGFDFPEVCSDSVWTDDQIVIKVPEGLSDGEYFLTVELTNEVINTESIVPAEGRSPTFTVDSSLPLAPSLCKIEPTMGPHNIPISLWGEYFGSSKDTVRFYKNKDQTGDAINYWGTEEDAAKIDTFVHLEAASGPVKVVKENLEGNGMNYRVGNCNKAEEPDSACGEQICCPAGTFKEGRCADSQDACLIDIPTSVYEWEFDTNAEGGLGDPCYINASTTPECTPTHGPCEDGLFCNPDTCKCELEESLYDNCEQRNQDTGNCDPVICPNSPGECSYRSAEDCDPDCSSLSSCEEGECTYNEILDNCVVNNSSCHPSTLTEETLGGETQVYTQYCDRYNGQTYWHLNTTQSCPDSWINIDNEVCIDEDSAGDCDICDIGVCKDTESGSVCAIDEEMCGEGNIGVCECCCRIGKGQQDCCSFQVPEGYTVPDGFDVSDQGFLSLICDGNCGNDTTGEDTNTYGNCSGCRIEDESGNVDQELSDQACVCDDTSGKYCDVGADPDGDGEPEGVCRDCVALSNAKSCSAHHSTCCVDAMNSDNCTGGEGDFDMVSGDDPDLAYCRYHQCTDEGDRCDTDNNPVPESDNDVYSSPDKCISECRGAPELGVSCFSGAADNCNTSICPDPFQCMNEDGSGPSYPDDCGVCCCRPGTNECESLNPNNPYLTCQPDQGSCTGEDRGLCCGCDGDQSCGNTATVGCGTDTCCHVRPEIFSTIPEDNADNVCANTIISAQFDQTMNINSFTGNVLVVGEYDGNCPEGTEYLADASNGENLAVENPFLAKGGAFPPNNFISFFKNISVKIKDIFGRMYAVIVGENVFADSPSPDKNYCAVTGSVNEDHNAAGHTELSFSPDELLDTNRKYFVIIKGDENLDSRAGVMSEWNVGMNASDVSPVDSSASFNGKDYPHSYIWSFTTMADQGNNGVCEISKVEVEPASYLFQTTDGDSNENDDNSEDPTFDTVRDNDKVFTAKALNTNDKEITPVTGYAWEWDWEMINSDVAEIYQAPFNETDRRQLIRAISGVTDAKTKVAAAVNITDSSYSAAGDGVGGDADIRVFLCQNPWPPVRDDGTWYPWRDNIEGMNCISGSGDCMAMNYQFYYCRDRASKNTVDDLPAIQSRDSKIRGRTPEILKEVYFFREETPDVDEIELATTTDAGIEEGGKIALVWSDYAEDNAPAGEEVDRYNIYYDTDSGLPYRDTIEVDPSTSHYESGPYIIEGLTNGQTYFFAITAVYSNGQESSFSNEISMVPRDVSGPVAPSIDGVVPRDGAIDVEWSDQSDGEAVSFKIHYKASDTCSDSLNFGDQITLPYSESDTTTISGLSNGVDYCIGMTAMDENGNSSATTTSGVVTPQG